MLTTRKLKTKALLGFVAGLLLAPALYANDANTGIYINGVEMTAQQIAMVQQTVGFILPPGQYLVQDGCIAHLESGEVLCTQPAQGQGYGTYNYGNEAYANGGDAYSYGNNAYGQGSQVYEYGGGVGGGYGYSNSADGSSFHRGSDYSGGYSVGTDSNGCIYTPNWSNC